LVRELEDQWGGEQNPISSMAPPDSARQDPPRARGLRCRAEISCAALRANARAVGRLAGGGPELVMAIVKADAYGHGLAGVAAALAGTVGAFAVACPDEAETAASAAATTPHPCPPIYLLSPSLPEEISEVTARGWIPAVSSLAEINAFSKAADRLQRIQPVNLVIDTGMGRIGALPEHAAPLLEAIHHNPCLRLDSVSSHFPSADEDREFTLQQAAAFRQSVQHWRRSFGHFRIHLANSAGLTDYPHPPGEMARTGLLLYGISPIPAWQHLVQPVLQWSARISLVRDLPAGHGISYGRAFVTPHPMRIATITAGYGDGYPRHASGKGACVLIHGQRCPILGRITMDQIMADVSHLDSPPTAGDAAVLLGTDGHTTITATELAALADTIPWHLLTGITPRTTRIFLDT
jgi:alanine racemase